MSRLAANSKTFSSCSLTEFQNFIIKTGAACLLTHPNMKLLLDPSLCGNKILDDGESCDCGTEVECGKDPCCNYKTCTLKPGAKCATGACCSKCQFLPTRTVCRTKTDECDLPEYCTGTMADCPEDVFQENGNPCNNKKSVCYNRICQNIDMQCVEFFGPASRNANLECYKRQNVVGDRFGNCGGVRGFYGRCQLQDVLCGKIHCMILDGEGKFRPDMVISYYTATNYVCFSGDFLNDHFIDPLWVKDGTKCGEDKICINKKCTNFSRSACKGETTCSGHGVCDNKHKCHCDVGWNPPFCSRPGDFGKSVKNYTGKKRTKCFSTKDKHIKNWLLITFLLILPVTIIIFIIGKRIVSQKCLYKVEQSKSDSGEEENTTTEMSTEVDK